MNPLEAITGSAGPSDVRPSWRAIAVRTALPGLLTIVLFTGAIFTFALPALKNSLMHAKRDMAHELTTTAWTLLDTYASQVPDELTLEEAQRRAIVRLRDLRYGPERKDYFWINDMHPRMIMHPYRTELEGTDITQFEDVLGKRLFSEMVHVVETEGEGFVDYMWWWKDADRIESKISFVKGFEPWGWIIGTGIYIDDVQAEIDVLRRRLMLTSLAILGAIVLLIGYMIQQARVVETSRAQAVLSLRASERKFRGIFHGTAQFIGLLDPEGFLLEINDRALEYIGRKADEVCGRPFWETPWWERDPMGRETVKAGLAACRAGDIGRFEIEILDDVDQRVRMDFSIKPITDRDGALTHIVVEGWDITEMAVLQDQLRHSQKMEAVGQLAGGVAHDFNNILMGIMGHAELLLDDVQPGSEQAEALRTIINASERAGDLTRQLLSFSRRGKLQNRPIDMHRIVNDVVALLSRSIDRRITIEKRFEADIATVSGDPSMLQNAVLNLAVNARDAMDSSKMADGAICRLTFSTRVVDPSDEDCGRDVPPPVGPKTGPEDGLEIGDRPDCRCLELSVSDTGCGIESDMQRVIFEPFFTTKGHGEGTGLGLAGVFGCVQSHNGSISLASSPGEGTTFRILLPLTEEELPVRTEAAPARGGSGHVLLVDDEAILRNFAKTALGRLGYQVTTCEDGLEAVEYFRDHHAKVDLVILDLVMTRMGGEEAFHLMKKIDPNVRVLISSGFSRDNVVTDLMAAGAEGFLSKPYKLGEMSREVARVMGAESGSGG